MEIPKDQIIEFLQKQGKHDEAEQAAQNLPDTVDHEDHSDQLEQHGINPQELVGACSPT